MVEHVEVEDAGDAAAILAQINLLIRRGVAAESVRWSDLSERQLTLLQSPDAKSAACERPMSAQAMPVKANLPQMHPWNNDAARLMRAALLHSDRGRFPLVHRLAARLALTPLAWKDTLDADRLKVEHLAKAVRRDIHKMHAFVRFRQCTDEQGELKYLAWFEPRCHIVRPASDFFRRRFASLRWAILTPLGSVSWDRQRLHFGPPAGREAAPPADAGEQLWIAYYESIFNPARVKIAMMKREMPVAYWPALPEVASIAKLLHGAESRVAQMREITTSSAAARRRAQRAESLREAAIGPPDPAPPAPPALLAALAREAHSCARCELYEGATQTVWGEGRADARLMIIGEQPGDQEDLQGRPFVGPAGKLLREALRSLGWPVERLYFTNVVKHFKYELRGKRRLHKPPHQREALECMYWLEAEIRAIRPRALLALGSTARTNLLRDGLTRGDGIPVVCARHPAALLRTNAAPNSLATRVWYRELAAASVYVADD